MNDSSFVRNWAAVKPSCPVGPEQIHCSFIGLPAMVHSIDSKGRLGFVSDRWLEKLGYTRDEVIGRPSTDFLTEASRHYAKETVLPAFFEAGRCDEVPYQFVTKSGDTVDVLLSAVLRRDAEGNLSHTLAFLKDVTELRRTESALREDRERLHAIIAGTRAGTWEWNVQTGETRFNEGWAKIAGYTLDELSPTTIDTWSQLAHPEDLERSAEALERHFAGETDFYEFDARMRHKDGHWVWVHDRGRIITRTPDGKPEWMFGTHLDITRRVTQEQRLRRNEQILEQTGRMAGVGGWEVDLATKEILWTDETCRIHGVQPGYRPTLEEAIDFYAPEARPTVEAAVERAMQTGEGWDLELPFIRRDGARIWVRALGTAIHENGKPVRLVGAFQDISRSVDQTNELELARQRVTLATRGGGIGIWEYDLISNEVTLDDQMKALFGVQERGSTTSLKSWLCKLSETDRNEMALAIRRAILTKEGIDREVTLVFESGPRTLLVSANAHLGSDRLVERIIGVAWDVTDTRALTRELAEKNELMRVTFASIGDAVVTTDRQGRIDWMNPVAERLTGWTAGEARGRPSPEVVRIVNEETRRPYADPISASIRSGETVGLGTNIVLLSRSGAEYPIEESVAPIVGSDGSTLGAVLVFHDVTEQRRLSREMQHRATHDALTGLRNRHEFERQLAELLEDPETVARSTVLQFDLDHFKVVNDTSGHQAGDKVLADLSERFLAAVRPDDTVARIGGDEFAVILRDRTAAEALETAQTILERTLTYRLATPDCTFRVGASIGVVHLAERWTSLTMVMRAVDAACYSAKNNGRGRIAVWNRDDPGMIHLSEQMGWATRVEKALDEGKLTVYSQLISPIEAGAGAPLHELLVRIADDDGSIHEPSVFIQAAEQFGLTPRIDEWMVDQAIAFASRLAAEEKPDLVSFNVSGLSATDTAFQSKLLAKMSKVPDDVARRLCLEITEASAIADLDIAAAFLAKLRDRGVSTALDDFGAGATSFRYLRMLPLDYLKIDGTIVKAINEEAFNASIVKCFVDVARAAGVRTVAECVEHRAVLDRVAELGVDLAQGFLIDRPSPVTEFMP